MLKKYVIWDWPKALFSKKNHNRMGLKIIEHGSNEYRQMVQMRYSILREPLGLAFTDDELANERENLFIAAFDEDIMLGCCMLVKRDKNTIQLRQMAVNNNLQGKGIGASIIAFVESISRDKGFNKVMMHARDTSVGFYEKCGYKIKGDQFLELNIPHHVMEKLIF
ncbi:MAG TPA: GNAT family N-acetyltransferase [Ferruginibacter sp.]|nr:GNAT family N-acetyltransferase [Ferruginibacter sp.]HQW62418.1 GNAT family N-acetyltransferase [Ferruginibacter sp.]HQY17371.1 GNAT family N-acetyltransferase [Ferruginibacter sp.]HQY40658.1 GNAT family N-acetyltransferase [Ferruginibacter sp.]HRB24154.1 GNAT family N-acetyltransferase [Ferruginibacter sp.]